MAVYPQQLRPREELNLRLGIKSSLPQQRTLIASLFVIYIANNRLPNVVYSAEQTQNGNITIKLTDELAQKINAKYENLSLPQLIEKSPLFTSQIESLQVGIELFFHLGKIDFARPNVAERTGNNRYQKKISFATNMILIDLLISSHSDEEVRSLLVSWLNDRVNNSNLEKKLCLMLNTFTEETQFKIRDTNQSEIVFNQEGVYSALFASNEVSSNDKKEPVGPFRVYKSFLSSGMHPFIIENRQTIHLKGEVNQDELKRYSEMVNTSLSLIPKRSIVTQEITVDIDNSENTQPPQNTVHNVSDSFRPLLTAIRTKPFLLLAGISGTGKSRIVRELAFKSCPKCLQDKDGTTPGNYCMIEVKPNWHDSTELIGFYSNISKGFQFKKFSKFLVKAKMFPKVPFFVCLDEMNLAPVEQYFAEILSIIETRKHPKKEDGSSNNELIKTGVIVESQYFRQLSTLSFTTNETTGNSFSQDLTDRQIYMKLFDIDINTENDIDANLHNQKDLLTEGLTLPDNVIIIGTVNMDDTTHQFSRKVIDRSMTIEMNGGNLSEMFGGSKNLEYIADAAEQEKWQKSFSHPFVTADEVLEYYPDKAEQIKNQVVDALEKINKALKGTPFEVSYRVLNELTIMVGVMMSGQESDEELKNIINQAVDNILLMKILPRIEGDVEMFSLSKEFKNQNTITHDNRLEWLMALAPDIATDSDTTAQHPTAKDKIKEMIDRLNNQGFTRFWP